MQRISRFIFIIFLTLITLSANARKKEVVFEIEGKVVIKDGKADGVRIALYDETEGKISDRYTTASSGKFEFNLEFQKDYKLEFIKAGYYKKIILVSTSVPKSIMEQDSRFPQFKFDVLIIKEVPGVSLETENKPYGKISYSPQMDNFSAEQYFTNEMLNEHLETAVAENVDEKFNEKLKEAEEHEKKEELRKAIQIYLVAEEIKPKDKFVKDKIKELKTEIKIKEKEAQTLAESKKKEAQLEAAFNKLITEGDKEMKFERLDNALNSFKEALGMSINNNLAQAKINAVNELIRQKEERDALLAAQAEEAARLEAEFKKLISEGDQNVEGDKLDDAINSFKAALNLNFNNDLANSKINTVNELIQQKLQEEAQLAARAEEAAKLEAAFNRLIAEGDQNVEEERHNEAMNFFTKALNLNVNNELAQTRIDNLNKFLAQKREAEEKEAALAAEAAKQKKARYEESVARGEKLLDEKKYNDSKSAFKEAIAIDDVPEYPKEMIIKIDYLMDKEARAIAAAKEKEREKAKAKAVSDSLSNKLNNMSNEELDNIYAELIEKADDNFNNSEWNVAKSIYFKALNYKPEETYPREQIERCTIAVGGNLSEELLKEYKENIEKADAELAKNSYSRARFYYYKALEIKSWEKYPKEQLDKIDYIIDNNLTASQKAQYEEMIAKADKSFDKGEYSVARFYYQGAMKIKENQYPTSKLNEIKEILADIQSGKKKSIFEENIRKADEAMQNNNPAIAKFYYRKALSVDPDAVHPKEQLKKLESSN